MAKTLEQITKQIELLQAEAERYKRQEAFGAIAQIKECIALYGFSPSDLGFTLADFRRPKKKVPNAFTRNKSKPGTPMKYHDGNGNAWSGTGKQPRWFKDAIKAGRHPDALRLNGKAH